MRTAQHTLSFSPTSHLSVSLFLSQDPIHILHPLNTVYIHLPKQDHEIEIHRLLQTRSTLGIAKIPELVFDLRYDLKHAFDRASAGGVIMSIDRSGAGGGGGKGEPQGGGDFARTPTFQPGQNFVQLIIRRPFNGRGGDWVEAIYEAKHLTVMEVMNIISEMIYQHIDQTLDWDPLSKTDRSFAYEAYLNRPCPDEDASGRRLHLFCDKYMFGGIEQLPAKANGATAEGPSFLVKLMRSEFKT
ncbi:hypothetical protein FRC12_014669 [Ceratobasidium sp. 428]|nr:hypothetical protein FRC12_014669 [Ceratobasidium sp. 428]